MKEITIFVGITVLWFVLMRWVLPWCDVPTCMSGGCDLQNAPSCCEKTILQEGKQPLENKGERP